MTSFAFSKLTPGGNPTIILHDPAVQPGGLARIAAMLMSPMHLYAEQVGALYSSEADEWSPSLPDWEVPRLDMMGGEFCVNATRASAYCLAKQGRLMPLDVPGLKSPVWTGKLAVSGMKAPVRVLVSPVAESLPLIIAGGIDAHSKPLLGMTPFPDAPLLFCASEVLCDTPDNACEPQQKGAVLIRLPGISHVLVDMKRHPLPNGFDGAIKKETEAWRLLCGIGDAPASGVVWYERLDNGYRIWPSVAVKATGSECMESACGSASLAMALLHAASAEKEPCPTALAIQQPGGETLTVTLAQRCGNTGNNTPDGCAAWVSGPVQLVAGGITHVEN